MTNASARVEPRRQVGRLAAASFALVALIGALLPPGAAAGDPLISLAPNGVTVLCPDAPVGVSATINGVTYTKRVRAEIIPENAATSCTSAVTDMRGMFVTAATFNGDIGHWDTSNVTTMEAMFFRASAFDQDIGGWETASVTNMRSMFDQAESFNRDLSGWCVGSIPVRPLDFDEDALAWTLPDSRPLWGTCAGDPGPPPDPDPVPPADPVDPVEPGEPSPPPDPDPTPPEDPVDPVEPSEPETPDDLEAPEQPADVEVPPIVVTDVPSDSMHAHNINRLVAAGITLGCGPGVFCPTAPVTREQVASFLSRGLDLDVPALRFDFTDVAADRVHADAIQALAAAEITLGCGPGVSCPTDPVRRDQMASFLVRALDL